jgi:asparagine synthase (glutamine-hydrolysing)
MCGLTGFLDLGRRRRHADMLRLAETMADTLHHRGPDDGGAWADEAAGIALGHRRLSIVDLSPAGHQPMVSASGRTVIVYNGEIYNADELRPELEALGIRFRGHSDTEVILEACEAWGVERTASRLVGMFAFALWDRQDRRLDLVRDRMGIKPLYWGRIGEVVFFGSQPKSFLPHPDFKPEVDRDALATFLRFNYMPGQVSIFRNLQQVRPSGIVTIESDGTTRHGGFWDLWQVATGGTASRYTGSEADAVEELDSLLRDAVRRRMVADVPLGAFLSGGIDSSLVVALMQAQSERPIRTFSIGFAEQDFDEAPFARTIAKHLGTDHTELYVEPRHALDLVPRLADWYDEPFADVSNIATLLVSELARTQVTVSLSGDGGDELFGGYPRYDFGRTLGGRLGALPYGLRRTAARTLRTLPPAGYDRLASFLPASLRFERPGDRAHKLAAILDMEAPERIYRQLVTMWDDPAGLVPGAKEFVDPVWTGERSRSIDDFVERMQYIDQTTYLPDDILTKVDRASMAVSLEARVPLLDHRVVDFSWRLPRQFKNGGGKSKAILRRLLARYVPEPLFARPKMGFETPVAHWLRGPLRDWAEDLLSERSLSEDGLLNPAPIRARWAEHLSGTRNWQYSLWTVLMVQEWRRRWLSGGSVALPAARLANAAE